MLQYSAIDPKVCQETAVGRRKSQKEVYLRIPCSYDNLEETGC